jgi:uncharacterized protein YndB with AHSA1/START domain
MTYSIETQIQIAVPPNRVLPALTTQDGVRGWWTTDVEVDADRATYRFEKQAGPMAVTFRVENADERRVAMVCIGETNNADWLGTRIVFELVPAAGGTRVELVHSGYRARNEVYEMCTKGWGFFLGSLKSYLETGKGEPHRRPTKDIHDGVEIAAPAAQVLAALTTAEGIRGWWTTDCDVSRTEHTYRFRTDGPGASSTFRVEQQDARGIALACITETNGMDWVGTRLAFGVEQAGAATRVSLAHTGFAAAAACYEQCVGGWKHFLGSLKSYLETGTGTPHVPGAAAPRA